MISFDSETSGIDLYHGAKPFFVTTCVRVGKQRWWEWDVDPLTREPSIPPEELREITNLLETTDGPLILQNAKFDVTAMASLGFHNWPWEITYDTIRLAHILASNQPKDLTSLALEYLGVDILPLEETLEECVQACRRYCRTNLPTWRIATEGMLDIPSAKEKTWKYDLWLPRALAKELKKPADHQWWTVLRDYANADSVITLALFPVMMEEVRRRGYEKIAEVCRGIPKIAYGMEKRGITVNGERLERVATEYKRESEEFGRKCINIADSLGYGLEMPKGSSPNNSLRTFMFDVLKVEPIRQKKAKTDIPTLNKEAMEYYLGTLPSTSKALAFVRALLGKRSRDTACAYMEGYKRFWLPWGISPGQAGVICLRPGDGIPYDPVSKEVVDASGIWYVLHPSLNPTGTDTLRWSCTNPNEQNICVDPETEFLTERGWVFAGNLKSSDKVAQYWKNSGNIDFSTCDIRKNHFVGVMKHITTTQQIDLLLTPNHRCLLADRKNGRKFDVPASEFQTDRLHYQAGKYVGGHIELTQHEVVWLCAVQADGSYCKTDGQEYGIKLIFKKRRKSDRLRNALNAMKSTYTEKHSQDGQVSFYIGKNDICVQWAKSLMPEKKLGSWILSLSRRSLDLFCDELFLWDGDSTRKGSYSSSDKDNANWAQIAYSLSGSRSNVVSRMPSSKWARKVHHWVNVTLGKDSSLTTNFQSRDIPWDGSVYCVTVPSSYVIVRRNGRVAVTGNSKKEGFNLRYCFGPAPGREWWSLDAKNIELRIPFYKAVEKELIDLFERPDDPPYYGSNHLANFHAVYPDLWEKEMKEVGFDKVGPHCKKKYAASWYQWCKNGGFCKQYGGQEKLTDATFRRKGAFQLLEAKFSKLTELNRKAVAFAEKHGYIETFPDASVDPEHGYPLLCTRTEYGGVKPTVPLSYLVQGTAMWWMLRAMVRCQDQLDMWNRSEFNVDYAIALQVHDELVFDFPKRTDPLLDKAGEDTGKAKFRTSKDSNLWRIRVLQHLMEQGGTDLGIPTPVGVTYHNDNWSEGVDF